MPVSYSFKHVRAHYIHLMRYSLRVAVGQPRQPTPRGWCLFQGLRVCRLFVASSPLLFVGENLVGRGNLCELRRCIVARIFVWVVLETQLPVSLLDLGGAGAPPQSEHLVQIPISRDENCQTS